VKQEQKVQKGKYVKVGRLIYDEKQPNGLPAGIEREITKEGQQRLSKVKSKRRKR